MSAIPRPLTSAAHPSVVPTPAPPEASPLPKPKKKKGKKKTKKKGSGATGSLLDQIKARKKDTSPKWSDVPDVHVARSRFEGDISELVYYKKTKKTKKKTHMSDEDECKSSSSLECELTDKVPIVTIVHISDTHLREHEYDMKLPECDILIHSGDFGHKSKSQTVTTMTDESLISCSSSKPIYNFPAECRRFDGWLSKQCERFSNVVWIAGNHEISFNGFSSQVIREQAVKHGVYLQDENVRIYGLNIWGTPWTTSSRMGFSMHSSRMKDAVWSKIPDDTDILVTHQPPKGIFDLAFSMRYDSSELCELCAKKHRHYSHWGSTSLRMEVLDRIKPCLHLFGHVHDSIGFTHINDTTFINSAMDMYETPHRVRIVFDL